MEALYLVCGAHRPQLMGDSLDARAEKLVPTRHALKSVVHDVAESLMSRNSDVAGYWAVGQLLSYALETRGASYRFDLLCGTSSPSLAATNLKALPGVWSELFLHNLEKQRLARAQAKNAFATLNCDLDTQRASPVNGSLVEYPVTCRVEVEDDRGRIYFGATEAWAFPHDPAYERRSARGV
jgi:hypothetical protein